MAVQSRERGRRGRRKAAEQAEARAHESRHRHAVRRQRGDKGQFINADEPADESSEERSTHETISPSSFAAAALMPDAMMITSN